MGTYLGSNLININIKNNFKQANDDDATIWLNRTISIFNDYSLNNVEEEAFKGCSLLTTVNIPNCNYIGSHAFDGCTALEEIIMPKCTTIDHYAFNNCYKLTTVSFPQCSLLIQGAFQLCTKLENVYFPKCISIQGQQLFFGCTKLTTVNFPEITYLSNDNYAFSKCTKLTIASFPKCSYFGSYTFNSCYNLISLYVNKVSSIPTLASNVFNSTPIGGYSTSAGRYGSVFVPASLYSSFLTATNWSSISERIVSV